MNAFSSSSDNPFSAFDNEQESNPFSQFDSVSQSTPTETSNAFSQFDAPESPSFVSNLVRGAGERAVELGGNLVEFIGRVTESGEEALTNLTGINPGIKFGEDGISFVMNLNPDETDIGLTGLGKDISDGSQSQLGYKPTFTWDRLKGDITPKNLGGFIVEQGVRSVPDMAAALTTLPAYLASRTEEIAEVRADNKGLQEPSIKEISEAFVPAVAASALERLGAKGVIKTGGVSSIPGAAAKAAGTEGGTEFLQENIEYAGETLGTEKDFDPIEGAERGLAGMIAGAGMGGAVRTVTATAEVSVADKARKEAADRGGNEVDQEIAASMAVLDDNGQVEPEVKEMTFGEIQSSSPKGEVDSILSDIDIIDTGSDLDQLSKLTAEERTSDLSIYDDVYNQLKGVGRDDIEAKAGALLHETVFRRQAERTGRDIDELYNQFKPTIVSGNKRTGGLSQLDASDSPRGTYDRDTRTISLLNNADSSTFLHESSHLFFDMMGGLRQASPDIERDIQSVQSWAESQGAKSEVEVHEMFASGFETYLKTGQAPKPELKPLFERFKQWLVTVYDEVLKTTPFGANNMPEVKISDEVRGVMDRLTTDSGREVLQQPMPARVLEVARSNVRDRMDSVRFQVQDKLIDLKRAQEPVDNLQDQSNAYQKAAIWEGRAGQRLDAFDENYVQPVLQTVADTGLDMDQVGEYLVARHAEEANAYLAEINPDRPPEERYRMSGMSNEEAAQILEQNKDNQSLIELGEMIDRLNQDRVSELVNEDLITQDTANAWQSRYKHYVPLKRAEADEITPSRGQGFNIKGRESKMRTGSAYWSPANILANTIAQAEAGIVRAEKNRVSKALLNFVRENPNEDFASIDTERTMRSVRNGKVVEGPRLAEGDNELVVKENGVEHVIVFNPENPRAARLAAGMKNLQAAEMGSVVKALSTVTRFLSQY